MKASELFGHWESVRLDLLRLLDQLTDEQLEFTPREGLWSLGKVARHIAEAEEGWFRFVVSGELDSWPEFRDDDYATIPSVKSLLTEVHDRTKAYLATVDLAELDRRVTTPWGEDLSLGWIVWHVLEHEISHRGEIYLMLGLMGMEAPDV